MWSVSDFSAVVPVISVISEQLLFEQATDIQIPIGIILLMTAVINLGLILFVKWSVR